MATKVIMPQMGESIAEGTVVKWRKKVGERVERDETLFEISTDKVDAEIPSPASGVLTQILVKENETVAVNTIVAWIDGEGAGEAVAAPPVQEAAAAGPAGTPPPAPPAAEVPQAGGKIRSSPLVRRFAEEHHVDLSQVKGTGLDGRISKKDILAYLSQAPKAAPAVPQPAAPAPALAAAPQIQFTGPTHVVPMTPMRKQIAEHMALSKRTSAHVSTVFEVEMTRIVDLMARDGEEFERRHGLKLTYTPFFVRAAVEAIKQFPIVNASVEGTERARSKHLSVDYVQEGTFTITNPGGFGSLFGTPIIHQPQVAILGVGSIEKRPVVRNDGIAIRSMVYLTLTFDHRLIDGAVADQFMSRVKSILENWDELVL
ncbi:MAG: 2-oxo acid dehydrogenase subunit E2 [Acidobacteriia bacterium]|nr:2-oxo acid dehydrogenase subunit E2 [Terriglobia bacterium]